MRSVLAGLARLKERGGEYPATANVIAYEIGFTRGQEGDHKHARDGRRMAPAQRVIFSLTALRRLGLVDFGPRRDGLSGTAYRLTPEGEREDRGRRAALGRE